MPGENDLHFLGSTGNAAFCLSERRAVAEKIISGREAGRIDLPARIKEAWGNAAIGRRFLIQSGPHTIRRLDLDSKRWKSVH